MRPQQLKLNHVAAFVSGLGLMYLFDPVRGRARRAVARDKARSSIHRLARAAGRTREDLENRAYGTLAEAAGMFRRRRAPDIVIEARVRSHLGRVASHPRAICVCSTGGRVTLSGQAPASELDEIVSNAKRVRGVRAVENRLEPEEFHTGNGPLSGGESFADASPGLQQWQGGAATRTITLPELAAIAGTRAMLGAGVALLIADRLEPQRRRAIGLGLLGVGVISTIPLARRVVFRRRHETSSSDRWHAEPSNRYQETLASAEI